ncbi:MAG: cation transporter [Ignisphaera sp.]|nr:cation transporter [Ignisphaera sp.]MCX8167731.1 cation transporter [Ignisphaera sp.]MDW8085295.1 cation transporter dimerization domain-containing protein [Ignisphaera sp.]
MSGTSKMFIAIIFLSALGGFFKILGGFIGGSKSVFVDALTSIANTLAILMMYGFFNVSVEPPDEDHHYGHYRIGLGGPISTLLLYSFVAGVIVVDLYETFGSSYTVSVMAPLFACVGLLPYSLAITLARHVGGTTIYYVRFTAVEIIESFVTIGAAFAGAVISYLIDFIGAIALTSYLFVELTKSFREILEYISDSASKEVVKKLQTILSTRGIVAERIRVRRITENVYQGDIVVKLSPSISIEKAHQIIDSVEKDAKDKLNTEITIHIEPESGKEQR